MTAAVGACVFDAYGTLFDVHGAAGRWRDALGASADRLSAAWRRKQLEYTWLRSLMGRHADFWQVTGEALDAAMAEVGVADPALRDRLMDAYLTLDAAADAGAVLDTLRAAGLATAVLSNGTPRMLASAIRHAGLDGRLDAVLSVEEVGVYKPHPAVYRLAVDRLALPAPRICFVTANGWDAAGAAASGLRVAWLNPGGLPQERLPAGPEVELGSLAELPRYLSLS